MQGVYLKKILNAQLFVVSFDMREIKMIEPVGLKEIVTAGNHLLLWNFILAGR